MMKTIYYGYTVTHRSFTFNVLLPSNRSNKVLQPLIREADEDAYYYTSST